jgi:hypothetical protein
MANSTLVDQGIGVMVAVIVIGAVAIPTISGVIVTETKTVSGETESSTGSVPEQFTADKTFEGLVEGSETLKLEDSFDSTNYTLTDSQYNVDYSSGEFNVTVADLDSDSTDEINSTSDTYYVSYSYKPDGYLGGTTGKIVDYIPLALGLALFVSSIAIVRS